MPKSSSLANRRRILAECSWIRSRVEEHLAANESVVVTGDFNDGPGLDYYELQFGRSAVEIVMGDPGQRERLLRNPFTRVKWSKQYGWKPASARFQKKFTYLNALLDFVMKKTSRPSRIRTVISRRPGGSGDAFEKTCF